MLPAALAFSVATSVKDIANYAALKNVQAFMRYFGKYPNDTSLADLKELFLPYRYGHATQVQFLNPVCYCMSPVSCGKHPDLQTCTCTCMQLLSSVYGLCVFISTSTYVYVYMHSYRQAHACSCSTHFTACVASIAQTCMHTLAHAYSHQNHQSSSVIIQHGITKAQLTGLLNGISHGPGNRKGISQ